MADVEALAEQKQALEVRKAELRASLKPRIEAEIAQEMEAEEREFALALKAAVEEGVKVTTIQREVLKTNTWAVWTKFRDLAGIPSPRELSAQAKAVKAVEDAGYTFDPATRALTLFRTNARNGSEKFNREWVFDFGANEAVRDVLPSKGEWDAEETVKYTSMWRTLDDLHAELVKEARA